ncbi:MATE family efflux transporter [Natronosalvus vescus]|uniref:MATE family efflux transporter n=1 Tax=Natronosalvus vescus TaxID=2953881 RepID=UPI00209119BA|nr:MATE family efflux transporter [Natronosalvus vescus]
MASVPREEITNGSLPKALLVLAAPLLAQNLVHVANQLIDVFWLGRLGGDHVAAVGLNFPIIALLFTAAIGVSVGTQVVVSQRVGGENLESGRRAIVTGTLTGLVAGTILGLLAFVFARDVMGLFAAEPAVLELAAAYLAVIAIGIPLATASDSLEAGFVGWGDARAALYINLATVVTNVVLDPFLIFGWWVFPELGLEGAALASILGYTGGFLLAITLALYGRDELRIRLRDVGFSVSDAREIVDVGWPNAGQFVASQSVRVIMVAIVAVAGGTAAVAAYTIGARVASVAFIPAQGLQQAAQSVIGQNLGAENPGRATKTTWIGVAIAAGALTLVGVVQWLVPETLTVVFVPDATAAELAYTTDYLRILAYGYWAIGATYLLMAGFNGARRTRTSFVATLCQYWFVRLPVAAGGVYLLGFDATAVFWAVTFSNVAAAIGLGLYYWYETGSGMNHRAVDVATSSAD